MKKFHILKKVLFLTVCFMLISVMLVGCDANNDDELNSYNLYLSVNNSYMGSVYGGGTYYENQSITIAAVANSGYEFVSWNDGSQDNIRCISLSQNKQLQAIFRAESNTQVEKYYLNSISLYYSKYIDNFEIDYDSLYLLQLNVSYGQQLLGGFNSNVSSIAYSNSIVFSQKVTTINGYDVNNKLTFYMDSASRVLFDKDQAVELSINPYFQALYSGGVDAPTEYQQQSITASPNNSQMRELCRDPERNYSIFVSFDFKLA